MSKDTTNPSVIKHSAAIHIQNKITLLQRKTWNVLLFYAYDRLLSQDRHHLPIKKLRDSLDYNSNNEDYLKEILYVLTTCGLEWNILRKDEKAQWGVTTLLASAVIENGECIYEYSGQLRERLYNPTMYARISLSMQNKFESKYAQALWELCIDYLGAMRKYGETSYITVKEFKRLMGVENSQYVKEFKILNRAVLKPAVEEINKISDLRVSVDYQRKSRKIVALKFKIRRVVMLPEANNDQQDLFPELKDTSVVVKLLEDAGLSASDAWKIWQDEFDYVDSKNRPSYSDTEPEKVFTDYIREKVDLLKRRQEQGKVKNATGFLLQAIRQNYVNPEFTDKQKKSEGWKETQAALVRQQELEQKRRSLEAGYTDRKFALCEQIATGEPELLERVMQEVRVEYPFVGRDFDASKSPLQNYMDTQGLRSLVDEKLMTECFEQFDAMRQAHREEMDALDEEIERIQATL